MGLGWDYWRLRLEGYFYGFTMANLNYDNISPIKVMFWTSALARKRKPKINFGDYQIKKESKENHQENQKATSEWEKVLA